MEIDQNPYILLLVIIHDFFTTVYNKLSWTNLQKVFVINVIRYNREWLYCNLRFETTIYVFVLNRKFII